MRFGLRVSHNVGLCTSNSLVKGVAGGSASCEFNGLVYVAQDAQNTDARQTSRNIVLGDEARIVTKPQLEIYADDVKCSHGATVGQLDDDAILYMRQRGLSEAQAPRLRARHSVAGGEHGRGFGRGADGKTGGVVNVRRREDTKGFPNPRP